MKHKLSDLEEPVSKSPKLDDNIESLFDLLPCGLMKVESNNS
jgi:hypothetical protein